MCPIWPLHLVIVYLLALCPLWVVCQQMPTLMASFSPSSLMVQMDASNYTTFNITGSDMKAGDEYTMTVQDRGNPTVEAYWNSTHVVKESDVIAGYFSGRIKVDGKLLGRTNVTLKGKRGIEPLNITGRLPVIVVRPHRLIDIIFLHSVIIFVALIFINFGCAMDWPTVKEVLRRPIGPFICMGCQFLFMPLLSFGLGYLIFPHSPAMRLGMFFTGISPAGGASNIWTFLLGGNLNLSLSMTTISTIASFGLMPAWLFSLGQVVFANAKINVPYKNIFYSIIQLVVPLGIGLSLQRCAPRVARFMVKILKCFSTALLLVIIVFAIVTNLYIFKLFSWEIVAAGMGIPWLGYCAGYTLARLLHRNPPDALAISIETGIHNTGISIFLLKSALDQPEADITTVIPVSVAIMTPLPMICIYIYQKVYGCVRNRRKSKEMENEPSCPVLPVIITATDLFEKDNIQASTPMVHSNNL